ncbi:MAG: DUF3267 domain-containing protein [Clostridiaceae bacterium]|nr:DUF3267 domain-containing protein [Clostridiaceae bacterium]
MELSKLIDSGYKSTKITMSFLKANTVSLIYPIPIVVLYIAIAFFFHVQRPDTVTSNFVSIRLESILWSLGLYLVGMIVLIVLHEFLHALFFLKGCENGWKSIKFGVKYLTPYCHCKEATTVSIARQSCLAPLWAVCLPLGVVAVATDLYFLHLLTVVMIFGSGADLWVVWKLRPYNGKTCYALDMEDEIGMTVFEPTQETGHEVLTPDTKETDG